MSNARLLLAIVAFVVTACGIGSTTGVLAPAPNLYTFETGNAYPVENVPPGFRSARSDILYMTDRNAFVGSDGAVTGYGDRRNDSMAFGVSRVEYGNMGSWDDLIDRTQDAGRQAVTRLAPVALTELARFPGTPLPYKRGGGRLQTTDEARALYEGQAAKMRAEIAARLRTHRLDRVLVYVHGFNNEFEDGVGTLANLWHYSGRQSLPVLFSWPAGNDGPLAYFRDVESGEFSVFHMKEFLRILADVPQVKRIDIVAHSRGSAVMTTALRELLLEVRGAGGDPRRALKTGILVLAAADLDIGVTRQRLVTERFADAFEQINIYTNPDDGALKLSRIIGRVTRLGGFDPDKLAPNELWDLESAENAYIVIADGAGVRLGHAYFRENPAVLSDIVLALRTRGVPGSQFRPLDKVTPNIWRLHQNYPAEPLPAQLDIPLVDR